MQAAFQWQTTRIKIRKQSQTTNGIFITAHSDDCVYFAILFNINILNQNNLKHQYQVSMNETLKLLMS